MLLNSIRIRLIINVTVMIYIRINILCLSRNYEFVDNILNDELDKVIYDYVLILYTFGLKVIYQIVYNLLQ